MFLKAASTVQTKYENSSDNYKFSVYLAAQSCILERSCLHPTPEKGSMANFIDYLGENNQFSGRDLFKT